MRFLVTAGSTRERIDDVRDWGNIFTGNTGFAIATALAEAGEVELLTSNRAHLAEIESHPRIRGSGFSTHAELRALLEERMRGRDPNRETSRLGTPYDAVFMSAAVADYRPRGVFAVVKREKGGQIGEERWIVRDAQAAKVKSTHREIAVLGEQTEKLVDLFRSAWGYRGLLVKFKLEVGIRREELIRIGQESRKASEANYLVANTLDMVEGPDAGAFLLSERGEEWVPRNLLPRRMRKLVEAECGKTSDE